MGINIKRLNRVRLHSSGGIEVLETLNSGDKKPAFRQNGYELDEITKKSFALELDAANSEYIGLGGLITCNVNEPLIFNFYLHSLGTQFDICSETDSASTSRITIATNDRVLVSCQGIPTTAVSEALVVGENTIRLTYNGTDNDIVVNGVSFNLPAQTLPFVVSQIGRRGAFYANIDLIGFTINTETFNLTEGLGNQVFGSNGTIATINTSNAQGIERTNYGQWLKGDDTNGWNPYT